MILLGYIVQPSKTDPKNKCDLLYTVVTDLRGGQMPFARSYMGRHVANKCVADYLRGVEGFAYTLKQ